MKRILYLLGVFLILSIIGCGKPMSKGADDELIILAAIEDADAARKILTKIFSDTLYTPSPEPYYKAKILKPDELKIPPPSLAWPECGLYNAFENAIEYFCELPIVGVNDFLN